MLDLNFIKQYFVKDLPYHSCYGKTVELSNNLAIHAYGVKPETLLNKARPNEQQVYKDWRSQRWSPITLTYWQKVVFNSAKIRKAEDWEVAYPDEDIKEYVTKNYPDFDSFDNWFWNFGFGKMFSDPNGIILVAPLPKLNPSDDREKYNPYTYYFSSDRVIDYQHDKYAVLLSEECSVVTRGGTPEKTGRIIIFVTTTDIITAKQVGEINDYTFEYTVDADGTPLGIAHNFGYLPAFQLGGILADYKIGYKFYDSFISPCVPHWDEAVMDYSDHQVNKALHLHPDRWEIADNECPSCTGSGYIQTKKGDGFVKNTCSNCNGMGRISIKTPFGVKLIKPAVKTGASESVSIPTPPGGYIDRPIESLKLLKEEYQNDIREGLAALSMEFLMNTPTEQSGVAKAYDRDPLTAYYGVLSKHVVEAIYTPCLYFITKWRNLLDTEEVVDSKVPHVKIPQKFDVVISSSVADSLKVAHEAGMSSAITSNLEVTYAKQEYGETSDVAIYAELIDRFDPLAGKTEDQKMTILSNKGCTQDDYILSSKLYSFLKRAFVEYKDFYDKQYKDQKAILDTYTLETRTSNQKSIIPITDGTGAAQ